MKIIDTKDNRYKVGDKIYDLKLDNGKKIRVIDHYVEMTQPDKRSPGGVRVIGTEIEREYRNYKIDGLITYKADLTDAQKTEIDEYIDVVGI